MYTYLVSNPLIALALAIAVVVLIITTTIKVIQKIGLERVRSVVYDAFVKAENTFVYGENTQKFEYVVQLARSAIPSPFNIFITDKLLRDVVQAWFTLIKDLLDDGRLNSSPKSSS